jgi:putative peptide zinc metalloprotease protein
VFHGHGVASGAHDAFYTPGLLLLTFVFVVLSAGFHELGHASGLRAGGKLPRAMGAGIYLVYPAFYTDVSENYQLKRWARVRTDLGGFYFNLIFAIGVVALFLATGWEYLLFIVALICLEIIHQLLPFVRLDGYWALADMLGVPDFFSQMGAFVRSILPFRIGSGGRKLPALKWWAKIAYALYIVIVIPLLAVALFSMVKAVPRVVATAFDAGGKLIAQLGEAFGKGDMLLVAAIVLQLVFIVLPILGLAVILFKLGRGVVRRLWSWGKQSPGRGAVAALGSVAAVALLLFLWVPQLGTIGGVRSGGLVQYVGEFRPIASNERGTIGEAVPVVNDLLRGVGVSPLGSPSPSPSPSPSASPSGGPSASPSGAPTSSAAPATAAPFVPTAAPRTVAPTAAPPTPAPTLAPTPVPTAAPTATP